MKDVGFYIASILEVIFVIAFISNLIYFFGKSITFYIMKNIRKNVIMDDYNKITRRDIYFKELDKETTKIAKKQKHHVYIP